jgi:hypothetical protein
MPLARITTPLPEYFERLAQDLRARGFDVETASPGQFLRTSADLEITIKQCAPEDAARLAGDASESKDMCVLIAPGAKEGGIRSIEMIVLQPRVEAVQAARHRLTPAQVIEISSALVDSSGAKRPIVQPASAPEAKKWIKVKGAVQSSWDEISRTTSLWTDHATVACHAGWATFRHSLVPLRAFLLEIGEETQQSGRRAAAALRSRMRRRTHQTPGDEEQLVPSMFDLSAEDKLNGEAEGLVNEEVVIDIPERPASTGDKRFLKAAGAAALAAVAILLAVTVVPRPRPNSGISIEKPIESKTALPSSANLKPSAMVESGRQRNAAIPSAHVLPAKQMIGDDSEAEIVVRHWNRQPAPKRADLQPQIKRYTDLN